MKKYQLKNGESLIIREPNKEDAKALIDLIKTVCCETRYLAREPDEFSITIEEEEELITNVLNDPDSIWYVAEYKGKVVGQCSVSLVQKFKRFRHRAGLGLTVLKDYWNLGIGGKIMEQCINWCRENNVEQLELAVVADNERAKKMYQSFGFEMTGTINNALKYEDNTYADEYNMILKI